MRSEVQIFPDPPVCCSKEKQTKGAIAQLGEHLLCKQGVGGSIPPGSTRRKTAVAKATAVCPLTEYGWRKFFNNLAVIYDGKVDSRKG